MPTTQYTLGRRALAEFVATFGLVFFGAGAVVIDFLTVPSSVEAGEFVLNGLGHGGVGWVGIALAHWGAIGLGVYMFGRVSGAHINPAVTAAFLATRRMSVGDAITYIVAQLSGGIAGSLVFLAIRGQEAVTVGVMGATAPFPGVSPGQAVLAEAVITFFLMVVVMALAVDDRAPEAVAGVGIGFVIAMGILATGNITGASFNPARTLGPYVVDSLFGGPDLWQHAWIYVVGPVAGAVAGAFFYEFVALGPAAPTEPDEGVGRPADD